MRIFLAFALLFLSGCALFESKAERAQRNSPDFKAGYNDGCATASTRGADPRDNGMVRDEEAYRSNPAYHAGWGTGFNGCRVNQSSGGAGGGIGGGMGGIGGPPIGATP
jgi:hypothetical protein